MMHLSQKCFSRTAHHILSDEALRGSLPALGAWEGQILTDWRGKRLFCEQQHHEGWFAKGGPCHLWVGMAGGHGRVEEKNSTKLLPSDYKMYLKGSSETQPCFRSCWNVTEMRLSREGAWMFWDAIRISLGNVLARCPHRLPNFTSLSRGSKLCCGSGLAVAMSPLFCLHLHVSFFLRLMEEALLVEQLVLIPSSLFIHSLCYVNHG